MTDKITKETNLGELLQKYPKAIEVLLDYGLHCIGCPASGMDTLEQGALIHGFSEDDITEMVERVNEVIEHNE